MLAKIKFGNLVMIRQFAKFSLTQNLADRWCFYYSYQKVRIKVATVMVNFQFGWDDYFLSNYLQ